MAAQVARNSSKTLKSLLEDVRRGRGDAPDILSSIWAVLPEREKMVLRAMAETVRPEIESTIEQIVSSELNYQKFKKAMKSLISLNLIVVKPEKNSPDLYDLHPLVRQFVKRTFERPERVGFIEIVLKHYDGLIRGVAALLGVHMPYSMLERWSQKAELEIEAGLFPKAFSTLDQAHGALVGGGHNEEFIRVARKLFEAVNWSEAASKIKNFDNVLGDYILALEAAEQRADVDDLLRRYQETIPAKTARYIKYCDVRCHAHWVRRDFETAIEWGRTGDELKRATNVDTEFDCEHNLALAMRDGGDPAGALKLFLGSVELEQVIADCEAEGERRHSGALFGNVGRCLFLMGRIDEALRCFRRSGRILEDDGSEARISNQAYARQWIGEALAAAGDLRTARAFLVAAEDTLRNSLPARARRIRVFMQGLDCADDEAEPTVAIANRTVKHWLNRTAEDGSINDNRRTANVS